MENQPPRTQKETYDAFGEIYARIMNKQMPVEDAQAAINALSGKNRTYALELKRAELAGEAKPNPDFS